MKNKFLHSLTYTCLLAGSTLVSSSAYALCANPIQACADVNQSTTLTANCRGPLEITGNNLTLNLGGYSVCDPGNVNDDHGIIIEGKSNIMVKNGYVENNGEEGVHIHDASHISLYDLDVKDNDDFHGVSIQNSVNVRLTRVQIENSLYEGIHAWDSDAVALHNVVSKDNDSWGMYMDNIKGLTISGATVTGNSGIGIEVYDSHNVKIIASDIKYNDYEGILIGQSSLFKIAFNNVRFNDDYGIYVDSGSLFGKIYGNFSIFNTGADIANESNNCYFPNTFFANIFGTKQGCVK